ncbi:MFS transporter [Pseudarthrobacter sp. NamE5]|uniref:MFS transporter n=1 Tax=Pseudarthrobacter sp. NamE5 TaxID=2576839 RepID=UPI00110BEA81|nr:MFS transporter [Pseudarthrobacter sp. NamE5]TLM82491.1 CynX/NimT family MFS transporter [Pseudarthrobacter sp. NamE5]
MPVAERAVTVGKARVGAVFLGILIIAVNLRVAFVIVGPVLSDIGDEFAWSSSSAGLLTGLPLISFAVFSPVAPSLARGLGLDRALGAALLLLAAGIIGRSVPVEATVWTGTVLIGTGIAFLNVLLPSLVKRDLPGHVSQITGIYTAFAGAVAASGAAVVVPITNSSTYGWRLALGVWAGLALIALAILFPKLRSRPFTAAQGKGRVHGDLRTPWKSALGWQVTLFMGLQSLAFYVMLAWLPSIEREQGIPAATSGLHTSVFLMVGVLASLTAGTVLHHTANQRPIALGSSILAFCAYAGLAFVPQLTLLWVVVGALGCGSLIVIALSLFSLRTGNHEQAASLSGMAQSVGYAIAAAGPVAFGALRDLSGNWTLPLTVTALVMLVLCVTAVLAARDRQIG